jgi:hypothetical protein
VRVWRGPMVEEGCREDHRRLGTVAQPHRRRRGMTGKEEKCHRLAAYSRVSSSSSGASVIGRHARAWVCAAAGTSSSRSSSEDGWLSMETLVWTERNKKLKIR